MGCPLRPSRPAGVGYTPTMKVIQLSLRFKFFILCKGTWDFIYIHTIVIIDIKYRFLPPKFFFYYIISNSHSEKVLCQFDIRANSSVTLLISLTWCQIQHCHTLLVSSCTCPHWSFWLRFEAMNLGYQYLKANQWQKLQWKHQI